MKLRRIPTSVHAVTDYVTAPVLVAAPEVFGMRRLSPAAIAPRAAGAAAAVYSALTDYELGVRRLIPMRIHLALDAASGAALGAVPWITRSARGGKRYWLPHMLVGAAEVALALTTKTEADEKPLGRVARLRRRFLHR
jgi:hypothetical protein